jgi:fibronectin type 3 domain-containing protein
VPSGINDLDARIELRDANDTLLASAAPSDTFSATIATTVAAGKYYFVVRSQGNYGDVGQYTVSGTIVPVASVAAPSGLSATYTGILVNLNWNDNATNESYYEVQRSTDGVNWSVIASLGAGANNYQDTSLTAGATYYYRVRAGNGLQASDFAGGAQVTLAPASPTGLTASGISSSQIRLNWADVLGETSYRIERLVSGDTWTAIGTTAAGVTTYVDQNLPPEGSYSYRVVALNDAGSSSATAAALATTLGYGATPATPSSVTALAASTHQVNVSWADNANNETYYQVSRSVNGGNWSVVATLAADSTTYSDADVQAGSTYAYRVVAGNPLHASDPYLGQVTLIPETFVLAALYRDILNRAPDPIGWTSFLPQLVAGVSRQSIAQSLLTSPERYGIVVDTLYATYLNRAADPGGRGYWVGRLIAGASEDSVAIGLMSSVEFNQIDAGDTAFIEALYGDILGRASDPGGLSTYQTMLGAGRGRADVISALMNCTERYRRVVDQAYLELFDRHAEAGGLDTWSKQLQSGKLTARTLDVALISVLEYYNHACGL